MTDLPFWHKLVENPPFCTQDAPIDILTFMTNNQWPFGIWLGKQRSHQLFLTQDRETTNPKITK
jgi:hypothetical protein